MVHKYEGQQPSHLEQFPDDVPNEQELPPIPDTPVYRDVPYSKVEADAFRAGARTYQRLVKPYIEQVSAHYEKRIDQARNDTLREVERHHLYEKVKGKSFYQGGISTISEVPLPELYWWQALKSGQEVKK